MELRQIECFVALAEELHFGRAAERLFISQPALTKQIQGLEHDLNVSLFERTQRRVVLSAAGSAFLEKARRVLSDVTAAQTAAIRAAQGETGTLTLGFTDSLLYSVLPESIRRFRSDYPEVHLQLQEASPAKQLEGIEQDTIDVGILYPPIPASLCCKVLHEEPIMVALPQAHPLAQQPRIALRDLNGEPFIGHSAQLAPQLYARSQQELNRLGLYPAVVQEVASKQTLVSLVAAGIGVALLPASLQRLNREGVVYRPLVESLSLITVIVWKADNHNPTLENFLRYLSPSSP